MFLCHVQKMFTVVMVLELPSVAALSSYHVKQEVWSPGTKIKEVYVYFPLAPQAVCNNVGYPESLKL